MEWIARIRRELINSSENGNRPALSIGMIAGTIWALTDWIAGVRIDGVERLVLPTLCSGDPKVKEIK